MPGLIAAGTLIPVATMEALLALAQFVLGQPLETDM